MKNVTLRLNPLKRWARRMKRKPMTDRDARDTAKTYGEEVKKNIDRAGLKNTGKLLRATETGNKGNLFKNTKIGITWGFSEKRHSRNRTYAQLVKIFEQKGMKILIDPRRNNRVMNKWRKSIIKSVEARGR